MLFGVLVVVTDNSITTTKTPQTHAYTVKYRVLLLVIDFYHYY
jgi:hypothetical protein